MIVQTPMPFKEITMAKTINIYGELFELTSPYSAGNTIGEAEAKALNQTRAENIANNFRKDVKTALASGSAENLSKLRGEIAAYDASYEFRLDGAPRTPVDPVEREAWNIARDQIKAQIAASGRKLKEFTKEQLEEAYEMYSQDEEVLKLAKSRVNQLKKAAGASLEKLGLITAPPAAAT
jgi:hypothetical protein